MLACEDFETFCQTYKSYRKCTVLEYLFDCVVIGKLVRIDPYSLSHKEWVVLDLLLSLYLISVHQLIYAELELLIEQLIEDIDIVMRLDTKPREIYRSKAEVASACNYLAFGIVSVAYDSSTAAHVSDLGVGVALFIIFQIIRSIDEREVREKTLCGNTACQLEQIIVGIISVEVHAFLYFENMYREYRCLAVTETCLLGKQDILDDHSALDRGICTIVYGAERSLCTCTGIHGVQVVHKCFHSLICSSVSLLDSILESEILYLFNDLCIGI